MSVIKKFPQCKERIKKQMKNPFTKHPNSVNETYLQHMWQAIKFSVRLEWLAFCVFIHAIFPFLFVTTASDGIKKLNDCMKKRRK